MEVKSNTLYLAHYGIPGQKYGVRRFQNEDGSLTPEGRRRYGVGFPGTDEELKAEIQRKKFEQALAARNEEEARRKRQNIEQFGKSLADTLGSVQKLKTSVAIQKNTDAMKDARKEAAIARLTIEQGRDLSALEENAKENPKKEAEYYERRSGILLGKGQKGDDKGGKIQLTSADVDEIIKRYNDASGSAKKLESDYNSAAEQVRALEKERKTLDTQIPYQEMARTVSSQLGSIVTEKDIRKAYETAIDTSFNTDPEYYSQVYNRLDLERQYETLTKAQKKSALEKGTEVLGYVASLAGIATTLYGFYTTVGKGTFKAIRSATKKVLDERGGKKMEHSEMAIDNGILYLCHYGVKGMQKGRRRWTNPDGTLTEAGRIHYGIEERRAKDALAAAERKDIYKYKQLEGKETERAKDLDYKRRTKYEQRQLQQQIKSERKRMKQRLKTDVAYEKKMSDVKRKSRSKNISSALAQGAKITTALLGIGVIAWPTAMVFGNVGKSFINNLRGIKDPPAITE